MDGSGTVTDGSPQLPAIIYGAATLSNIYNSDELLQSATPLHAIRLALQCGIRAFDTSPSYGTSEILLGNVLEALRDEFPRSSYQLMTKCGRYGPTDFDYDPAAIRESVKRSLSRLKTDYLDILYLHDVEFVCSPVSSRRTGDHSIALTDEAVEYGLTEGDKTKVQGRGDQSVLNAFAELQRMKEEGLVRHVGITGYPLPTLLRLAILVSHTPGLEPVDVALSYSHLTLQNATFLKFISRFEKEANVKRLVTASPLSMGLLTSAPPSWHPAPFGLLSAAAESSTVWSDGLPNLALGYSIRNCGSRYKDASLPLVVGFSSPEEIHECVKIWSEVQERVDEGKRTEAEEMARKVFQKTGFLDWSWASP